jgi:hypothetical protein
VKVIRPCFLEISGRKEIESICISIVEYPSKPRKTWSSRYETNLQHPSVAQCYESTTHILVSTPIIERFTKPLKVEVKVEPSLVIQGFCTDKVGYDCHSVVLPKWLQIDYVLEY